MDGKITQIKAGRILVSGQALTSRTETLEDYLRTRCGWLRVVAVASPFTGVDVARRRDYEGGRLVSERPLRQVYVRDRESVAGAFLLTAAFLNYLFTILREGWGDRSGRYDVFVGISCFSAFVGACLKRLGRVRKLVYYSIDYYPTPPVLGFNSLMVWAFRRLDAFCALNADVVWHITERITDGRSRYAGVAGDRYRHVEVPLCYRDSLRRTVLESQVERWTIGFVGTLTEGQGVQLLVDCMPELVKVFPELRVRIVGRGPYAAELERRVAASGCKDRFVFHGFIPDEEQVLDLLARCAVAVAPWTQSEDNNILFADPGKPKLYACLGVPCVVTRGPDIAATMERAGAGLSIDYTRDSLQDALVRILRDDQEWRRFRHAAAELGREFVSERVLADAVAASTDVFGAVEVA